MKKIKCSKGTVALVSDEDFAFLAEYKWFTHPKGYIYSSGSSLVPAKMHRAVASHMGLDMSQAIDHINGDRADNRRSNLRSATNGQNRANSKLNCNNKSGFKGVHLQKKRPTTPGKKPPKNRMGDRWVAQINVEGKKLFLGRFNTPEGAHAAYTEAAKKHFGEFARP